MTAETLSKIAADLFGEFSTNIGIDTSAPGALPPAPAMAMYFGVSGTVETSHVPAEFSSLFDSVRGKNLMFDMLRALRETARPDIMAVASDSYAATSTDAGQELGTEKFCELSNEHGIEWMFRQGYAAKREAITSTAQTAEEVVMLVRPYAHKNGRYWSWFPDEIRRLSQADLTGRMKLW